MATVEKIRSYLIAPPAQAAIPGLRHKDAKALQRRLIYEHQRRECPICSRPDPQNLDHDHDTGLARGLLCIFCNRVLGKLAKIQRMESEGWIKGKSDSHKPAWMTMKVP